MPKKKREKDTTISEYERFLKRKVIYPKISKRAAQLLFRHAALSGENGEVAGKIMRLLRDEGGVITSKVREGILSELGDVLWNLSQLARFIGFSLEDVMEHNMKKLKKRIKDGTIQGKGDAR